MNLLLDTHSFIWWANTPEKLSKESLAACQNKDNVLVLSAVSVWEMQIKIQLGKLKLKSPLKNLVELQQQTNDLRILPVELDHVLALSELPTHHKDPFDRLLVAQAKVEEMSLVSADKMVHKYPVQILW